MLNKRTKTLLLVLKHSFISFLIQMFRNKRKENQNKANKKIIELVKAVQEEQVYGGYVNITSYWRLWHVEPRDICIM